eukprot:45719-Pyramimonas_sp.AAC.1
MDRQASQLVLSRPIRIPHPSLTGHRPSSQVDAVVGVVEDPDRAAVAVGDLERANPSRDENSAR